MTPVGGAPVEVAAAEAAAGVSRALASAAGERLRIVATLIRVTGNWDLAEDAFQDAVTRALTAWAERGIPDNPGAWLTTVARNIAVDTLRRASTERGAVRRVEVEERIDAEERAAAGFGPGAESGAERGAEPRVGRPERPERSERRSGPGARADDDPSPAVVLDDDRLRLIYTCCHPALAMEARIALTLRTVVGLEVEEIARAFLVSAPTMQKRLVRARAKIREAGIPYRVPGPDRLAERTDGVLAVLYLLFTEGYSGSGAELLRVPLADEAIRLARLVVRLLGASPHRPEALALLALLLFQHSRRDTRLDSAGDLVLIEDQDRRRWDRAAIDDGLAQLRAADRIRGEHGLPTGAYRLQAEIAGCHATAPSAERTDFARIAELYGRLARVAPSPVVELNRAVAIALAPGPEHGPVAGLAYLDRIDDRRLDGYHLLHATRGDLLRRAGRAAEAAPHYRRALELAPTEAERRHLRRRIDQIECADG